MPINTIKNEVYAGEVNARIAMATSGKNLRRDLRLIFIV